MNIADSQTQIKKKFFAINVIDSVEKDVVNQWNFNRKLEMERKKKMMEYEYKQKVDPAVHNTTLKVN